MTYLLISNLVVCGACAWCVRGVAAHVSSTVPLQRSRNGEPLMVVTLRWKSNHFLGQQSHPHPCFPPVRISFSRWEDLHPKYYPPATYLFYFFLPVFLSPHISHLCFFPPLSFSSSSSSSHPLDAVQLFITIVRKSNNSIVGRLRQGVLPTDHQSN